MTFLYALATLWPKVKRIYITLFSFDKIFLSATQGHKLVYARQAFLAMLFCFILFSYAQAQSAQERADARLTDITPLIVGQKVPEEFWTKKHLFYVDGDTVRQSLLQYKGKPLVLDFWASWCSSCLNSFSKLESLKAIYGKKCNIILINGKYTKDNYTTVEKIFRSIKDRQTDTTIPSILEDEYIGQLFPHVGIPYVVWITKSGMVQSLTRSQFLLQEGFENLLN